MDALELDRFLATCRKHGVQSAQLTQDGGIAVVFEPKMSEFDVAGEPAPGGWKTSPVTPSSPPIRLDLEQVWGDAPRAQE